MTSAEKKPMAVLIPVSVPDRPRRIASLPGMDVLPLAAGVDAGAFDTHYRSCLQERKLQRLQRLFTGWHFYAEPVGLGFFPGKLFADLFLSPDVGLATIVLLGSSSCLAIAPWLMRHRLRRNAHKRYHVYYMTAVERCITEK